jgi:hypothetical protein
MIATTPRFRELSHEEIDTTIQPPWVAMEIDEVTGWAAATSPEE